MKRLKFGLIICGVLLVGMVKAESNCTDTVRFNTNGGNKIDSLIIECGSMITAPKEEPTKGCYTFAGWYSDSELTTVWDFATSTVTQDTTLYAKWNIKTDTISFESNGGSKIDSLKDVECGSMITAPKEEPTKDCYTFTGWYSDSELTTVWDFATSIVTQDTTLYAKWNCATPETEIVKKKGSSTILICKEVQGGIYQWGYYNKKGTKENKIPNDIYNQGQGYSYYQFAELDTVNYVYFVNVSYKDCDCLTTTEYKPNPDDFVAIGKVTPYPNPTKGHFSVALGAEVKGKVVLSLQNLSGQRLLTKQIADYENSEVLQFDLNSPAGIYLLVVRTNEGVLTSKIVIE